jgi:histidyl-tRNA synthetase
MSKFQKVRGTRDLYGTEKKLFNYVIEVGKEMSFLHNFEELETPIFEFSEIYERNLGEGSDIVLKETYKFEERGGNSLTLRPEFTAGIVRAVNENPELIQNLPAKFFSYGPVFRYERPQAGRYRQFSQINCEHFGPKEAYADVEMIALGYKILNELEILDKVKLEISSLGCEKSRANYEKALISFLKKHESDLSDDSKIRLKNNPLRILDSKDEGDKKLLKNMPIISDFYEPEAKEYFEKVKQGLEELEIEYVVNPRLVRGLDYYTSTVFEFVTTDLGAQGTVLAGGRYDNMMKEMGAQDIPAIGFGAGIERLVLMTNQETGQQRPIAVIPVSENEETFCFKLLEELRRDGIRAEMNYNMNLKKRMQKANKINASAAIIIGEEEINSQTFKIKDFAKGEEFIVKKERLLYEIEKYL